MKLPKDPSFVTLSGEDGEFTSAGERTVPISVLFDKVRDVFKFDSLGREIAGIALPAALALTADPIASLVDTAFIGQIGPVELAAVGVAIVLFNQVSRIAIFPLVSITTSFVAEEDAVSCMKLESGESEDWSGVCSGSNREEKELILTKDPSNDGDYEAMLISDLNLPKSSIIRTKRSVPSASSALIIGSILGLLQTVFLITAAKPLLKFMGVGSASPMLGPALEYLKLRSLGAPPVLLALAMNGVFRGFKDTKTPLFATIVGDVMNAILDPILMFVFRLGVRGAAIAHILSQYLICIILLWRLMQEIYLLPPCAKHLQLGRFLSNGFLLLMRVVAVTFCVTLAASMAARLGPTSMAAFQVCLQIWLATSLLADGLAVAGQAILASAFAKRDIDRASAAASRVLQLGLVLGLLLALVLGTSMHFGVKLFSRDPDVLRVIAVGIPFITATQPINVLAFVFDGINFGASDFTYSAYSMVVVAIFSIMCLFMLSSSHGFIGIWIALTLYMSLRAIAGFGRIGTGTGPWKFLWRRSAR
ncbi:hypothetical protein MLD38_004199 [Melastoma candidum]|uniref:Uncharacterized protein n=1 Tax=Melastoma candidum TaxID=119954 RepID=A0ACB9S9L0_9MYRT|nr:hypothetical protein MLD38_004199 [Melastoma candidum]